MYLFRISNYDEALCTETAELLSKRLEAESRRRLPAVWKLTDDAAAYAAAGPGRERRASRYRVYGAVLLALGVFVLVPGLMEPQSPALIAAGAAALLAGAVEFALAGKRKAATPPKSCRKDAQKLFQNLCAADFEQNPTEIAFDDSGMTVRADGTEQQIPYESVKGFFETERLWLLVYGEEKALLLQRRDLSSGNAEDFAASLRRKIGE